MWGVGDRVVCIDTSPSGCEFIDENGFTTDITEGSVYVISYYHPSVSGNNDRDIVRLEEFEPYPSYWKPSQGHFRYRFRKVKESNIDIFRKMCENEPALNKLEIMRKEMQKT